VRVPKTYIAILTVLGLLAGLTLLVYLGVPPFDSTGVFVLANLVGAIILIVFGVIGGAFVGMLLAHRVLSNTEFTPFERTMLSGLDEMRERLAAIERRLDLEETKRLR